MPVSLMSLLALAGTIDQNALKAVVKKAHPQINACYEPEAKLDPKLQGDVFVGFTVVADGSAKKVSIKKSDLKNKNVESCIVKVFQGLSFPKPEGGNVEIAYPLGFAPADVVIETKDGPAKKPGSLAPELIRNTVATQKAGIQSCFESEKKKDGALAGKVLAEFTVELDGTVSQASVKEATLKNEAVQGCLLALLKRLTFPKPEGDSNVKVTFPFNFN